MRSGTVLLHVCYVAASVPLSTAINSLAHPCFAPRFLISVAVVVGMVLAWNEVKMSTWQGLRHGSLKPIEMRPDVFFICQLPILQSALLRSSSDRPKLNPLERTNLVVRFNDLDGSHSAAQQLTYRFTFLDRLNSRKDAFQEKEYTTNLGDSLQNLILRVNLRTHSILERMFSVLAQAAQRRTESESIRQWGIQI